MGKFKIIESKDILKDSIITLHYSNKINYNGIFDDVEKISKHDTTIIFYRKLSNIEYNYFLENKDRYLFIEENVYNSCWITIIDKEYILSDMNKLYNGFNKKFCKFIKYHLIKYKLTFKEF